MSTDEEKAPMIFRLCVIGDWDVGKTSLILRYVENKYEESDQTKVPTNFDTKTVIILFWVLSVVKNDSYIL